MSTVILTRDRFERNDPTRVYNNIINKYEDLNSFKHDLSSEISYISKSATSLWLVLNDGLVYMASPCAECHNPVERAKPLSNVAVTFDEFISLDNLSILTISVLHFSTLRLTWCQLKRLITIVSHLITSLHATRAFCWFHRVVFKTSTLQWFDAQRAFHHLSCCKVVWWPSPCKYINGSLKQPFTEWHMGGVWDFSYIGCFLGIWQHWFDVITRKSFVNLINMGNFDSKVRQDVGVAVTHFWQDLHWYSMIHIWNVATDYNVPQIPVSVTH